MQLQFTVQHNISNVHTVLVTFFQNCTFLDFFFLQMIKVFSAALILQSCALLYMFWVVPPKARGDNLVHKDHPTTASTSGSKSKSLCKWWQDQSQCFAGPGPNHSSLLHIKVPKNLTLTHKRLTSRPHYLLGRFGSFSQVLCWKGVKMCPPKWHFRRKNYLGLILQDRMVYACTYVNHLVSRRFSKSLELCMGAEVCLDKSACQTGSSVRHCYKTLAKRWGLPIHQELQLIRNWPNSSRNRCIN